MAGVAGGVGRALSVDPVLIRIAFAVLTIFGGSGVALYAAAWLLMPSETDEVSGAESLLGRGRSSMSPVLAVVLGVVVIASVTSSFTWGLSLVPYAAIAVLVVLIIGRKRKHLRQWAADTPGVDWSDRSSRKAFGERAARDAHVWSDDLGRRAEAWGNDFGRRAQAWGDDFGRRAQHWGEQISGRAGHGGHSGCGTDRRSTTRRDPGAPAPVDPHGDGTVRPFDTPPAWETTGPERAAEPVDLRTSTGRDPAATGGSSAHSGLRGSDLRDVDVRNGTMPHGGTPQSPPRWDPLGAAPFAWDLPEPGPTPPSPAELRRRRRAAVVSATGVALALAVAAVGGVGVWLGWWQVRLALVSGAALAVVALFVLGAALRGRRSPLIGFGVMLALATGFLAATGTTGTSGIGERTWTPMTEALTPAYRLDAGHGILDLRSVTVAPGTTVAVSAWVGAGNLEVVLPSGVTAQVACTANLGSAQCLGQQDDGIRVHSVTAAAGDAQHGTIALTAHVGTGEVAVSRG